MATTWMLRLGTAKVVLLLCLSGLFNIERLHEPIYSASIVYVLTGLLAAAIILTPKFRKAPLVEITLVSLPAYAFAKWRLGYSFFSPQLRITMTECVVVGITNFLAWCVAHQIDEFMRCASKMSAARVCAVLLNLDEGEGRLNEAVWRARRIRRPLALATVAFSDHVKTNVLDRLCASGSDGNSFVAIFPISHA